MWWLEVCAGLAPSEATPGFSGVTTWVRIRAAVDTRLTSAEVTLETGGSACMKKRRPLANRSPIRSRSRGARFRGSWEGRNVQRAANPPLALRDEFYTSNPPYCTSPRSSAGEHSEVCRRGPRLSSSFHLFCSCWLKAMSKPFHSAPVFQYHPAKRDWFKH